MKDYSSRDLNYTQWFQTPLGQYVLSWEQERFDFLVRDIFGCKAWQVGFGEWNFLRKSQISFKAYIDNVFASEMLDFWKNCIITEFEIMPFESQSLDLFLLPHIFERAENPYAVLKEIARILAPDGRILISGFNPWSLWGLKKIIYCGKFSFPFSTKLVPISKLRHWLRLLSFDLNMICFGCYAPACMTEKWIKRWGFMESIGTDFWYWFGAVYLILATKRVVELPLIKSSWKSRIQQRSSGTGTSIAINQSSSCKLEIALY